MIGLLEDNLLVGLVIGSPLRDIIERRASKQGKTKAEAILDLVQTGLAYERALRPAREIIRRKTHVRG